MLLWPPESRAAEYIAWFPRKPSKKNVERQLSRAPIAGYAAGTCQYWRLYGVHTAWP
jgi:hypothetical protein